MKIEDKDIIFVTTTLYTKWLGYQSKIVKELFPNSKHVVVDGRHNWPLSWFYWIDKIKNENYKYFIHIDEDFFITSKDSVLEAVQKMEDENLDLMGVPDGLHHYRGANPVAINTFLMIGRLSKLESLDFKNIQFSYTKGGWMNNQNLIYKESFKKDWSYKFTNTGGSNFEFEQEPYYAFLWKMKELGCKFGYLYPHFDERFKSTNPRLREDSLDLGIHLWYTRQWNSNMDVWGLPNIERYNRVEKFLLEKEKP